MKRESKSQLKMFQEGGRGARFPEEESLHAAVVFLRKAGVAIVRHSGSQSRVGHAIMSNRQLVQYARREGFAWPRKS
jgi:hypothetical protein